MTTLLSELYPPDVLRDMLLPRADWHPYPTVEDRPAWVLMSMRGGYTDEEHPELEARDA